MITCDFCSKTFETYRQLNGHKRIHSDALYIRKRKPKILLKCKNCDIAFEYEKNTKGYFCSVACNGVYKKNKTMKDVGDGINISERRIKDYFILKYGNKCMDPECTWDQDKRPINVELDHIDGDHTNNALSNFRLLCPCCHSLTPTYKNKNKGNGRSGRLALYHKTKKG